MKLGAVRRRENVFDVVLFANAFEEKIKRGAFAEGTTFTMMAERFVTPPVLAALIRTDFSDDGSMLRVKFD